jgi:hypothetical protein
MAMSREGREENEVENLLSPPLRASREIQNCVAAVFVIV